MTGPGEGKILIKAQVYLDSSKIDANVYIHLKGFSFARVTHLDIESAFLNILPPKRGGFFEIHGVKNGLDIKLETHTIELKAKLLNEVLSPSEHTRTWVGGKVDGIYIGFRKTEILRLERLAKKIV